jgi:hypothetical protein
MVAKVFGYTSLVKAIMVNETEPCEPYHDLLRKVRITGIHLSGENENEGVIVTAALTTESKMVVAMSTHRLRFADDIYGFEEELHELVTKIAEESFKYIFQGKKAQLELFDKEDDGTDTDK